MDQLLEILKAVLFGIVEGITEWLPVSSTGHMILLDEFVKLEVSENFYEMFQVVIQLGAIFAVVLMFWKKLWPFGKFKPAQQKKNTWNLWFKVVLAVLPSAVLGLLLDDWLDANLYNYVVVATTLIVYGVAFIWIEKRNGKRSFRVEKVHDIDWRTAIFIGCFQCLSLIPGTSRSGATILGAILLGVSRSAGAEFSFFLAIPTMLGASALKLVKFIASGVAVNQLELSVLMCGCCVAFLVSVFAIQALMNYVRKKDFAVFGYYRIALGLLVLGYFLVRSLVG